MDQKTAMKNNLIALLDQTFPGANGFFDSPARSDGSPRRVINTLRRGAPGEKRMEVHTMRINYNVTGNERKALVKVISETTGAKTVYKFMRTCAYEIDYFTVTKEGLHAALAAKWSLSGTLALLKSYTK